MVTAHPPDDLLLEEPLRPEVARHLRECAACRVHSRRLRRALRTPQTRTSNAPPKETAERFDLPVRLFEDEVGLHERVWDRQQMRMAVRITLKATVDAQAIMHAIAALKHLQHPNLGRTLYVTAGPPMVCVQAIVPGQDLQDYDLNCDPRGVAWLVQTCSTLVALHEVGLCHGHLTGRTVRVLPHGAVVLLCAGLSLHATAHDDWVALAQVFDGVAEPVATMLRRAAGEGDEPMSGPSLLAWLAAQRDPGAGGSARYLRTRQIGEGGMGEVYRVADPVTGRDVAQKVLSKSLITRPGSIQSFVQEARIAAQLEHPGIVPVHDIEFLADGAVAFTMKLVQGQRLGECIQQVHEMSGSGSQATPDEWTLRRLVQSLRRVCDAAAYAHDQGVVHLDLKPDNVMLGDYGEVLLMDWGLARRLEDDGRVDARGGTAGFTAPELLGEVPARVGASADVYGLGQILRQILDGEPPPHTPGTWIPIRRVPGELVSIVRHATQIAPDHRYTTVRLLSDDLQAWLDGTQVRQHTYSLSERVGRTLRPHAVPLTVVAIATVVLLSLGTVAGLQVWSSQSEAALSEAQMRVEQARLALGDGDRIAADRAATSALSLAELPEARGLLARLALGWRPTLLHSWSADCFDAITLGDESLFCTTPMGSLGWLRSGEAQPHVAGGLGRLRRAGEGWSAVAFGDVVLGVPGQERRIVHRGSKKLDAALVLSNGTVVTAVGDEVVAHVSGEDPRVLTHTDSPVAGMTDCGEQGLVVVTEDGSLHYMDGRGALYTQHDQRAAAPITCSSDGRQLAVATVDHEVQLWRLLPRMKQRPMLQGHLGAIKALDWSPDDRRVASTSEDGTVRLWSTRTGAEIGRLSDHEHPAGLGFLDEETLLTVAGGVARVWNVPARPAPDHVQTHVASQGLWWGTGPEGRLLVVHDRVGRPSVYAADLDRALNSYASLYTSISVAPAGRRIAGTSSNGDVTVVDLDLPEPEVWRVANAHPGGATAIAWHPLVDRVASADRMGAVRVWYWNDAGSAQAKDLLTVTAAVTELVWSADGHTLVAGTVDTLTHIDVEAGTHHTLQRRAAAFVTTPDGEGLLVVTPEGTLVRLGQEGEVELNFPVQGRVVGVDHAPHEAWVASISSDGMVQVYDSITGDELARVATISRNATDIRFSRDGERLATVGVDGVVMLLDTRVLNAPVGALADMVRVRYGAYAVQNSKGGS